MNNMNEPPFSPGVAIVVLLVLWGLAGAIAGPEFDAEAPKPTDVEHASTVWPPVRLLCEVDRQDPPAPQALAGVPDPRIGTASLHAAQDMQSRHDPWPGRSLRCLVLDE